MNVCTAYELDGKRIDSFPHDMETLSRCKPVCEEFPGWELDPAAVETYEDLPENARRFVEFLESGMGVKATFISMGPERSSTILREAAYSFDSK